MDEKINHPEHYHPGIHEAINVIEAWKLNFNLGNVLKYISRAGHKDTSEICTDLEKAKWYLSREIHRIQTSKLSESISKIEAKAQEVDAAKDTLRYQRTPFMDSNPFRF